MKLNNSCRRTSVVVLIIAVSILVVISYHLVDKPHRYLDSWRLETFNRYKSSVPNITNLPIPRIPSQQWTNASNHLWTNASSQLWTNASSQLWTNASSQLWTPASSQLWTNASSQASKIAADTKPKKRYLIYLCDGDAYCYGLGDRQRGLIGVFILSEVTNRQFGIKMTAPAPFRDFYEPNKVLWDISEHELINKSTTIIKYFKTQTAELNHINFNEAYPQDVVYVRTNQEIWRSIKLNPYYKRKFPDWARGRRCNIFANAWLKLTRPTLELRTKLNEVLVTIAKAMIGNSSESQSCTNCTQIHRDGNNTKVTANPSLTPGITLDKINDLNGYAVANLRLVCAHVRMGHSDTLPFENDRRNSFDSVSKVWDFLRPYVEKGHHVYLATDSDKVR
ncbi:unnamed protein product [Lymnaea stagnalis]|uniref:Uncharacterized protein n=1 Tax=Lymnaea stagnalis TaxID=6523 RepID=A0AAV2IBE7_LYMST